MSQARAAADWLCNPKAEVSAHYLIASDGEVMSLVPEALRAWHAGAGRWGKVTDVNSHSIGIELDHPGEGPFEAAQIAALIELLKGIVLRWQIRPERIIGHSDLAPGRKIDPGPLFPWQQLAQAGLAVWPNRNPTSDQPLAAFRTLAQRVGYTADVDDTVLLAAFRLRFRPTATGPLDSHDIALLDDLAQRYPVDDTGAWV